eukprot:7327310-Alexandrium_andersonii.AAC.1
MGLASWYGAERQAPAGDAKDSADAPAVARSRAHGGALPTAERLAVDEEDAWQGPASWEGQPSAAVGRWACRGVAGWPEELGQGAT